MSSLLEVQLATDAARLKGKPQLLAHKYDRMKASSFAFLRGALPLWAEVLHREPRILEGLPGEGTIVGDLHLENFGTFRTSAGWVFHVNDFDETRQGPWAYDVLRLLTSIELSADAKGVSAKKACRAALDGFAMEQVPAPPHSVEKLLAHAEQMTTKKLFEKRLASNTSFKTNDKQPVAPKELIAQVPRALELWRRSLPTEEAPSKKEVEVLDVRRRISGTGSLGVERLIALTQGDAHGPWIIDIKASRGCVAADVVEGMRRCLPDAPLRYGAGELGPDTVMVHPLAPGEEKIDVAALGSHGFENLCLHTGALAGQALRSGSSGDFKQWGHSAERDLLERASHLAQIHRDTYVAFLKQLKSHH